MKKTTLTALLLSVICCHAFAQPVTSGLKLHLMATSGFNDNGAAAATWQDLSGTGNNVAAGNASTAEPTYTVNAAGSGYDGIYFNGSGNYMFRSAANTTGFTPAEATLFVVRIGNTAANTVSGGLYPTTLSIGDNNSFNNEYCMMGDWTIHTTSSGNWLRQDHQCYATLPDDKPVVLCGAVNTGVAGSDIAFYVNGIQSTNTPATQSVPVPLTSANRSIVVGGRYDGSATANLQTNTWFSGYVLEVLAYDHVLSGTEIDAVNEYLKCKYQVNYASCNVAPQCPPAETCKDGCYWKVTGNNIMNGENIFGTLSDNDIRIQTSGADRGIITSTSNSNGFLGWNTMAPTARLHVNCDQGNKDGSGMSDVRFENLESGRGSILVIDDKGYVFNSKVPLSADGKYREMYNEEKAKVEKLESDMKMLSDKVDVLMNQKNGGQTDIMSPGDASRLYQNTPNPFGKETTIAYYVAQMQQGAYIMIYDLNGRTLSKYPVTAKGKGSVKIDAENMAPGVYLYSLVIDGQETDSKRMIISK